MGGDLFPFLFFGGFILLAIVGVGASIWWEKKRREKLRAIAHDMGLSFEAKAGRPDGFGFGVCPLFNRGRSRKVSNLMHGTVADVELSLFDYRYTTGSGKNSSTHRRTVAAFEMTAHHLPQFELGPEGFFHRIASMLGFDDIDFDTHPTFSEKYRLRSDNEAAVRDLFKPTLLEFFEQQADQRWTVEAIGSWVVVYRSRGRIKPDQWPQFLDDTFVVMNALTPGTPSGDENRGMFS